MRSWKNERSRECERGVEREGIWRDWHRANGRRGKEEGTKGKRVKAGLGSARVNVCWRRPAKRLACLYKSLASFAQIAQRICTKSSTATIFFFISFCHLYFNAFQILTYIFFFHFRMFFFLFIWGILKFMISSKQMLRL